MPEFGSFLAPTGAVMICGVPVAAIAEPQSVRWLGVGLREVPVDPGALPPELLADSAAWLPNADWLSNTELGFAGGFVDPLSVPGERDDGLNRSSRFPIPSSDSPVNSDF